MPREEVSFNTEEEVCLKRKKRQRKNERSRKARKMPASQTAATERRNERVVSKALHFVGNCRDISVNLIEKQF